MAAAKQRHRQRSPTPLVAQPRRKRRCVGRAPRLKTQLQDTAAAKQNPAAAPPEQKNEPVPGVAGAPQPGKEQKTGHNMRLLYAGPNRLRMEMIEKGDTDDATQVFKWISDGKFFWSYNPAKNLYTKEKAPSRLKDFLRLTYLNSGCLELVMLMGVNPFANIGDQVGSLRYAGRETVNDVETDVLVMEADLGAQTTEARLYIGAEDHLLRRMVSETTPKSQVTKRAGVGSALDELAEDAKSGPPISRPLPGPDGVIPEETVPLPAVPMRSRVSYDNTISLSPRFDSQTFTYAPPAGAYYQTVADRTRKPMTLKERLGQLTKGLKTRPKAPIRF